MWLGTNVTSSEVSEDAVAQAWMEHQAIVWGALSGSPLRGGAGEEQWTAPASEGDLSEEEPLLPNLSYLTAAITLSRAQISLRLRVYV